MVTYAIVVDEVKNFVSDWLQLSKEINCLLQLTAITKRNKELHKGDFMVHICKTSDRENTVAKATGLNVQNSTNLDVCSIVKEEKRLQIVSHCNYSSGNLYIFLNRSLVISKVLTEILTEEDGRKNYPMGSALIFSSTRNNSKCDELLLDDLRCLMLAEHSALLLKFIGYDVHILSNKKHAKFVERFLLTFANEVWIAETCDRCKESLQKSFEDNIFVSKKPHSCPPVQRSSGSENPESQGHEHSESSSRFNYVLDLEKYLESCGLKDFDKNIKHLAIIDKEGGPYRDICCLEHCVNCRKLRHDESPFCCIHVTSQSNEYYSQQIDVASRILLSGMQSANQVHVAHGQVGYRELMKNDCQLPRTVEELYNIRRSQVEEAFIAKYGKQTDGKKFQETVDLLTVGSIKFELLSTSARQTVKLQTDSGEGSRLDRSGGVFVLYNCARLANILHNYHEAINKGIYPSLPNIEEINCSLLREEEEWESIFSYMIMLKAVVNSALEEVVKDGCTSRPTIYTHKICQFLNEFSRCISRYYNRIHILQESRSHLYPTMFARLFLIKGAHRVMVQALNLIGIQPLTMM